MKLVSGLFKIVCATCPAHAVVHESVRYQDGLLVHYECHGKQYCVHVLDTELESLSPEKVAEMRRQLAERLPAIEAAVRPESYTEDEWIQLIADGHKTLDLLSRFAGGM